MGPKTRRWAGRCVVLVAALASVATSPKRWHLTATVPAGMPTESPANGSAAVLVTIESSGAPDVTCMLANGQPRWYLRSENSAYGNGAYLCPPGGKVTEISLTGRVKGGGLCSKSNDGPPKDQYVRVTKSELVPVWHASVEEVFDVSSDDGLSFSVDSPRTSFVEAVNDDPNATTRVSISSYAGNNHYISVDGGTGSNRVYGRVRVRATVYGICDKECAKPADEPLRIVRSR